MKKAKALPLEGIRIVEIATAWVGPGSVGILSSMGAEVIKIENPAHPDFWRRCQPFAERVPGINRSGAFALLNRGKKDCELDLKSPEGAAQAKEIVKISDMVITNFAPRVMGNFGLGYADLCRVKPDIIMVSASGYGIDGPDRDRVAFGPVLEAYSGISCLIGHPGSPQLCGTSITDHIGAINVVFAALAALHHRRLTGEGQFIDLAETESALTCMGDAVMEYTMTGRIPEPCGNHDEAMFPHNCYRCRGDDKWLAIAIANDDEWRSLCRVMGKPELATDERFADGFRRWQNQKALDKLITAWASQQDDIKIVHQLQKAGVTASPIYSAADQYQDAHLKARRYFVEHEHPEVGKRVLPGVIVRLSETPGKIEGYDPLLGEHNEWVQNVLLGNKGIG
ncbi:MAG: CoA transferase [Dehalococcoidales bacterium]|nr:CoA transferase [Dehalococcoidales bacterium]